MRIFVVIILSVILFSIKSFSQAYPNNENGQFEDMLTPAYYHAQNGDTFRNEMNKFVYFARLESFQHPLEDSDGQVPSFTIHRKFGDGIGRRVIAQYHPATDFYIGNGDTLVNLYAAYDGYIRTVRGAPKYRDYLSLTKEIKDSANNIIGKMVVIYGHIDLDLDSMDNILLNGQFVKQGDVVSKHLYSGTRGGPHLHYEIRYYRAVDSGDENYYGGSGKNNFVFTEPSSGNWRYGYWSPDIGYGYANTKNHLLIDD